MRISHTHVLLGLALLAVLTVLPAVAQTTTPKKETGFETGNEFTSTVYGAYVQVSCQDYQGRFSQVVFTCQTDVLDPAEEARFQTDQAFDADKVIVTVRNEDGSSHTKDSKWDRTKNRSDKRFNLWNSTLFNKAFFELGRNDVTYQLEKKKAPVANGSFTVTVKDGGQKFCPTRSYYSHNLNDCSSPTNACNAVFRDTRPSECR